MRIVMILLALILISCKKEIEPKPVVKTVDSVKAALTIWKNDTLEICSSKAFTFTVIETDTGEYSIRIYRKSDSSQIQTIETFYFAGDELDDSTDVNFDGFQDLSFTTGSGSASFTTDFWIYNPTSGKFFRDSLLSDGANMHVDTLNKLIFSKNWLGHDIYFDTYQFINGTSALVMEERFIHTNYLANQFELSRRKLVDGKMKLVMCDSVIADTGFISFNPSDYPKKKRTN